MSDYSSASHSSFQPWQTAQFLTHHHHPTDSFPVVAARLSVFAFDTCLQPLIELQ